MIASVDNVGFVPTAALVVPARTNMLSPEETTSAGDENIAVSLSSSGG